MSAAPPSSSVSTSCTRPCTAGLADGEDDTAVQSRRGGRGGQRHTGRQQWLAAIWHDNPTSRGCCRTGLQCVGGHCPHRQPAAGALPSPSLLTPLSKLDQGAVHVWVLPPCQLHCAFDCCCLQQGPGLAAIHLGSSQLRLKVLGGSLGGNRAPGGRGRVGGRTRQVRTGPGGGRGHMW